MADARAGAPPRETTLGEIEQASLGEVEQTRLGLGPMERALVADVAAQIGLRVVFTLVVIALFGWLNFQVMNLVRDIFAETKSLDKEIVMALIGGTVTQLGVVTYMMARFLFPSGQRSQEG